MVLGQVNSQVLCVFGPEAASAKVLCVLACYPDEGGNHFPSAFVI